MLRFSLIVLIALPLAACATGQKPYEEPHVVSMVHGKSINFTSQAQSLADMAVDEKPDAAIGAKPCPRFLHNVSSAETTLDAQSRNYPHML